MRDSPVHTVCCSEDPAGCYDGASTQVLAAEVEADLPRELTRPGDVTSNNTGAVLGPGATLWSQIGGRWWEKLLPVDLELPLKLMLSVKSILPSGWSLSGSNMGQSLQEKQTQCKIVP